jgi:hypothetical protein
MSVIVPESAAATPRYALGMPSGSVRSILAILVVAMFCALVLFPTRLTDPFPPYLLYLLFLILGHLFAFHVHAAKHHPAPLHLPRILVRLVIIVALAATLGWKIYSDPTGMRERWDATVDAIKEEWYLPLLLLGGFFVGAILHPIIGRDNPPIAIQDLQAWLALIAIIGLCVLAMVHLIIEKGTTEPILNPMVSCVLATIVAFYFGARS